MRLLSSIDWPLFFERVSLVEQILREDPAGAYARMDFPTRDRYRHSVEQLARGAEGVRAGRRAGAPSNWRQPRSGRLRNSDRTHHVGYYLISRGRFRLEQEVGYPPTLRDRFARFFYGHPVLGYLGTIAGVTALAVASFVAYAHRQGGDTGDLWLTAFVVLLPLSELAISLINLVVTSQVSPRQLPKLDMRGGHPRRRIARWSRSRRSSIPRRAWCRSSTTSRCGSSRTAMRICISRCSRILPTPTSPRSPTTRRSSRRRAGASTS